MFSKKEKDYWKKKEPKKRDPIDPETVLLGLIFVSLGPLRIFPITYPPRSDPTQQKIREYKVIFTTK